MPVLIVPLFAKMEAPAAMAIAFAHQATKAIAANSA
jgi:hypothetical protein